VAANAVDVRKLMRADTRVLVIVALVLAGEYASGLERIQERFATTVELVHVDVAVMDRDRRPIVDLVESDFAVFEDGKQRPIVAFARVELPTPSVYGGALDLPFDGKQSEVKIPAPGSWPNEGRLVVILFDRSIPTAAVPAARVIASQVVDSLGPTDLAAVTRTSQFAGDGLSQSFTADRDLLKKAIASPFIGATAPPIMGPEGLRETTPRRTDEGDCWCGTCVLDDLRGIVEAVRDVPRLRKILIFIGSDMTDETGRNYICLTPIRDARQKLERQLDDANVTVHAFDPQGLTTDTMQAGSLSGFSPGNRRNYGMLRRDALADLPRRTGGRAVLNTNSPAEAVRTVLAESATYYLLGFQPANPVSDGRRHRIDVKVKRRVGVLTWRKAYYAG
jgi:VWFA-related protein